ncbi:putative multidrug-efflux transporter [Mycobacterium kiyosense]|uniref:Multidrug efflux pump Tap n=1 Tax=Mycobacterium kiyosense TaxID=2871094 RepID=A0A9P3Q4F2_9MYCO|nr:MFS transporter [Mycobacterium kiyosense]BDB44350.1 putative multidrug-efflux transporter [Mycobacterium kiyosense]GLB84569.1 putative multidrug-efflux transporter [Mycobacterium kiyosense]GLB97059.1 putative multidrug-efflux transporter [Mycobacterium kiyosense]GLD00217.1 putative multidrug-efflux transporter [Mycobacterium kiyosense]GLD04339.1 putative multidrug-efflux transporter [Mycobacterium kiyosense]
MENNRGPVILVLFASLMACAGDGISIVAFPWLVLQRQGSAGQASIVAGATTLPLLVSTLVAGTAVDFFGRRRVSMVADALSGSAVAGVPLVAWAFGGQAVDVAVLAVLGGCAAAFDPAGITARQSMLPEAAARAGWSLDRVNSSYEAILNLAFMVGPGIGGLMIATVGGITTMWITAGAFAMSILAIAVLRLEGAGKPVHVNRPRGLRSGIADGLRFVWSLRVLRTLALIDLTVTALYLPMETVLFPKYFSDRHQPGQLGSVLMALSLGGLLGALGYVALAKRVPRRVIMLTAVLTFGAAATAIALLPPLPVILLLVALVGLVYGPIQPIYAYVVQTRAPAHLRGRVVGVMASLAYAAGPLGLLLAGPLADAAGLHVAFLVLSLPILATGWLCIGLPSLRELDRAPEFAVGSST